MTIARIHSRIGEIPAAHWDALHDGRNPFVRHAFLDGLEQHGCLRPQWGWSARHCTIWEGDKLIAAAPAYAKENSHGEFVFDHAWAHAYARNGLDYFPKWLCAVPYSPVTGPRLLARDTTARQLLLSELVRQCERDEMSSVHVNFHDEIDDAAFGSDWLARADIQYHWRNGEGWRDFSEFLAAMDHKHRKNIRQERARVTREGVRLRVVDGVSANDAELAAMHGFYLQTFAEYGNHPALTLEFLHHLREHMPEALVIVLAERGDEPIAGALCVRGADTLYGRYWGATENVPGLHFEVCYYQGIEYCLREGLTRFEPGAQGEHKLARGFLPTYVRSRHWLAHPVFRKALASWCAEEACSIERYAAALAARSPFKSPQDHAAPPAAAPR